jgi:hypothetical protein
MHVPRSDTVPHRLVYISSAPIPFGQSALEDILDVARRCNGAEGITGILLYHDLITV